MLGLLAEDNARDYADVVALSFGVREWTWREVNTTADAIAARLRGEGLKPGSRVAILTRPSDSVFLLMHGVAKAQCVFTPLNWRLAPMEMEYVLNDSEADILFLTQDLIPKIAGIRDRLVHLHKIVLLNDLDGDGYVGFQSWLQETKDSARTRQVARMSDTVVQLYTSGTTGRPKGALLSNAYIVNAGIMLRQQIPEIYRLEPPEVLLHYFPVFHIGGVLSHYHAAIRGCGIVIFAEFDPGAVLRTVSERNVPNIMAVPTMWQALLDHPDVNRTDFSKVRYGHYGAAPMPDILRKRAIETVGCEFAQYYGMTESVMVTCLGPDDHTVEADVRMQSVGKPLPGVELRIIDEEGADIPQGKVGEIAVRSNVMMSGYWKLSEESKNAFLDGWYRTGDGGMLDTSGYLFLKDRIRDMIISGGENIYSAEVESALLTHPDVADAAVIGVADERWGEVPKAFIIVKPGRPFNPASIRAHAEERLARYKLPKVYEQMDDFPRTPLGKIQKFELRNRANNNDLPT